MSTGEALAKAQEAAQIPQDARDKARELGWEDGLIELVKRDSVSRPGKRRLAG